MGENLQLNDKLKIPAELRGEPMRTFFADLQQEFMPYATALVLRYADENTKKLRDKINADAEDLFQDTMVKFILKTDYFRKSQDHIIPAFREVMHNAYLDRLKKKTIVTDLKDVAETYKVDEVITNDRLLITKKLDQEIVEFGNCLPGRQSVIFYLCYVLKLENSEIVQLLKSFGDNASSDTIKNTKLQVYNKLREHFGNRIRDLFS